MEPFAEHRPLDRARCLELLASTTVGRVAITECSLPAIVPVDFRLTGGAIELAADHPLLSSAARDRRLVCFEADGVLDDGTGWSVLVFGRLARSRAGGCISPAAPPASRLTLSTALISGRQRPLWSHRSTFGHRAVVRA